MTFTNHSLITLRQLEDHFPSDVRRGLTNTPKYLPCKYIYDAAGSELFEKICQRPEYYPTRVENRILQEHAAEIVAACPSELALVEFGSGSSEKTRHLLRGCLERQPQLHYYAIDVSADALAKAGAALTADFPRLHFIGLVGDFMDGLKYLRGQEGPPRLIAFLGSTIGNFDVQDRKRFVAVLREQMRRQDFFLLGYDLLKDPSVLLPAYDDAQGATAAFNLNLLARINRELGGNFDLDAFQHQALFNADKARVEMHLVSRRQQRVRIQNLDLEIAFQTGETIHTENSHKYSLAGMQRTLADNNLRTLHAFTDEKQWFCVALAR